MWYRQIPVVTTVLGLISIVTSIRHLHGRHNYRGMLDNRVPKEHVRDAMFDTVEARAEERDIRLSLYQDYTEWVHPVWSPKGIQKDMKI